jgi:predicted dehydrogenase
MTGIRTPTQPFTQIDMTPTFRNISGLSRRGFLGSVIAGGVAPMFVPARLLGQNAPSKTLNVAFIGVGNQGGGIAKIIGGNPRVNPVAICDIDDNHLNAMGGHFGKAKRFNDFREMLEKMDKDIDAVTAGVPDHSHFPIAMHAMGMGKAVFVEKPLANTFLESRLLMEAAKKHKVAVQMGNQGFSGENYHQAVAFKKAGLYDGIHTVVAFMNNARRWHAGDWKNITEYPEQPVPSHVHWQHWHTTAQERPYSDKLHNGNWRGWYRYGMGALGDWGPHVLDTAHYMLELGLPTKIELVHSEGPKKLIFPLQSTLKFTFPARGPKLPAVELYWHDGQGNGPKIDEKYMVRPDGQRANYGSVGRFLIGGKHDFYGTSHAGPLRIIPEAARQEHGRQLPKGEPDSRSDHYANFVLGALGEEKCRSSFDIAGPLNQVFNLGTIAMELQTSLEFDPATGRFKSNDMANELLRGPAPRKGWEQYYAL